MTARALEFKKIYCPSGQVIMRHIADETILVPVSGNLANMERIFTLNEVGAAIWGLLDGKRRVDEILKELLQIFAVEEDQLAGDLVEFLDLLKSSNLIEEQSSR